MYYTFRQTVFMVFLICVFLCGTAAAETMYVTDVFTVTVRSGKGNSHRIIKMLKSNQNVNVLTVEGDYAKVSFDDGSEGWMLKRYLTAETPKPVVIQRLQRQVERLQSSVGDMTEKLRFLKDKNKSLETADNENRKKIALFEKQYEDLKLSCADFLKLKDEHEKLKRAMEKREKDTFRIVQENRELKKKSSLLWFLAGSFAVLAGFIIGLTLQNLRGRRKRSISF